MRNVPELCEAIGIPRVTNCQVRPTTASKLKAKNFEDRTIMSLTGHKKVENLQYYAPKVNNSTKFAMAKAIFSSKRKTNSGQANSSITTGHTSTNIPGQISNTTITTGNTNQQEVFADVHAEPSRQPNRD